jgi:hypothetical protein
MDDQGSRICASRSWVRGGEARVGPQTPEHWCGETNARANWHGLCTLTAHEASPVLPVTGDRFPAAITLRRKPSQPMPLECSLLGRKNKPVLQVPPAISDMTEPRVAAAEEIRTSVREKARSGWLLRAWPQRAFQEDDACSVLQDRQVRQAGPATAHPGVGARASAIRGEAAVRRAAPGRQVTAKSGR